MPVLAEPQTRAKRHAHHWLWLLPLLLLLPVLPLLPSAVSEHHGITLVRAREQWILGRYAPDPSVPQGVSCLQISYPLAVTRTWRIRAGGWLYEVTWLRRKP
jgi:hypothetical protein